MNFQIKGVIIPLLTPFSAEGALDLDAVRPLVDFLIQRGVHGLFPGGTTGEGVLLSGAERKQLCEAVVQAANGRVPVIAHAGALTTTEALELTVHARGAGAQAAALLPPFYYHYSDDALFAYFSTVAQAAPDFPIFLYNFPAVTGNAISPALVARLADACPNIVGMKDSSGNLTTLLACADLHDGRFIKMVGSDGLILGALAMGVEGCVSGNANVVPELVVRLYDAAAAGDLDRARKYQYQFDQVRKLLGDGGNLSLFKGVLAQRGVDTGPVRPPQVQTTPDEVAACWDAVRTLVPELAAS